MLDEKEFYSGLGVELAKSAGFFGSVGRAATALPRAGLNYLDQTIAKPILERTGAHMANGATQQVTNNIKDTVSGLPWGKIGIGAAGLVGLPLMFSMLNRKKPPVQPAININFGGMGGSQQQPMSFAKPHSITG